MCMKYFYFQLNVQPTKKRFVIGIRVGANPSKSNTRGTMCMSNIMAAAGITSTILRSEEGACSVMFFTDTVQPMPFSSTTGLDEMVNDITTQVALASAAETVRSP